jgi:uncharacterized phage-associated protein
MPVYKYQKAVHVLNFFAKKEPNGIINKMKALKLVWLSDRYHLRRYGRPILFDSYVAMKYGPVASGAKDLIEGTTFLSNEELEYRSRFLQSVGHYYYRSVGQIDLDCFSKTDQTAMDIVYDSYGGNGQFELSELSHAFPEWNRFEAMLKRNPSFEMDQGDFFENPDKNFPLFDEEKELLELNKAIFKENRSISG